MENSPHFSEMHVLITGGAGFIGSNLADELVNLGSKVTVLDNLMTGHIENISHLLEHPRFTFIKGDIRDFETCQKAIKGCTHVSHQAALGSIPRSIDDPLLSLNINILGTTNIFFASVKEGVRRVTYASSSSVYGTDETLPKIEEKTGMLISPYASSKRSMELIQEAFVNCYDLEIIGFRYFNVFGPRQDPNGPYAAVIPKFISLMMNGETPQIFGDGEQSRDFTHISNVINGNIRALTIENVDEINGKAINLAFGGSTTVNQLFYGIRDTIALSNTNVKEINPSYQSKRLGDILHSHADISIAKLELGFVPGIGIDEGLQKTVEWYLEYGND
jgi:UDP-N-acetylglucosamine 4-epimerase